MNATMRKITVTLPGNPTPQEVFVGPGFGAISDIDGSANVVCQAYYEQELINSVTEGRKAVPIPGLTFSQPINRDQLEALKSAHPDFVDAWVGMCWAVMYMGKVGDPPASGEPDTRKSLFEGSTETFGPGHDLNPVPPAS